MPYSSSIYSISSTETIPIPEAYYSKQHPQAHSLISQDPQPITFSTASPTILPMTDHIHHDIDIRDLDARLARIEQHQQQTSSSTTKNGSIHKDDAAQPQRRARSSFDSTVMPRFTKSATMSTTDTNDSSVSRYSAATGRLYADPSSRLHPETVGLAPGAFSKPRVHRRSRRDTDASTRSHSGTYRARSEGDQRATQQQQQQFKYYGRHGNQWLFNDFSVTDAVSKGFKRVFGSREAGAGKDWYEDRH